MSSSPVDQTRWAILRVLLVAPSFLFVAANLLKFELGVDAPYDALEPVIAPVSEPANFLVAAVVILGPIAALLLTLRHAASASIRTTRPGVDVRFAVRARWSDVLVMTAAIAPLIAIGIHFIAEGGP